MEEKQPAEKPSSTDRAERLTQVRHLQTLRWAYLSTYLVAIAWFIVISFDPGSTLRDNSAARLFIGAGISLLGLFIGLRVRQYTKVIRHDLDHIGTSVRGKGWIEYTFAFVITGVIAIFTILSFFGRISE